MNGKCLMIQGTASSVGKSVLCSAFLRIMKQDGWKAAPFKAQNMSLNSFVTRKGLEMGRAQVTQAQAAGIEPDVRMNPVLLKPTSDRRSQVIVEGKAIGNMTAMEYHHYKPELRRRIKEIYETLESQVDCVVIEGAGSPAEINLREGDIVNMSMAQAADAPVILVGDIDRGGVFASVYGSIALQTPEDRRLIKGIIINKFRGDMRLFDEGRKMLEEICGVPVLGVIPYYKDIYIEEEDSVALAQKSMQAERGKVNVAVVMLRHLSNYTDFDALERDPRVHLFYTNNTEDIKKADIIILPGTKSTLHDLYELRRNGCAQAIIRAHREGAAVLGICGGYQMMGMEVLDPDHVEGDIERLPGLGLLPTTTTMNGNKHTRQVTCQYGGGYEIHQGETHPVGYAKPSPLLRLDDGREDGYIVDGKCMGTYVHGILDNAPFVDFLLEPFKDKIAEGNRPFDYAAFKEEQYDKLAAHVRRYVDMDRIYNILTDHD